MPLTTQSKILRVLTDQSFTRVSGQRQVKVDVRVISSTALNLATEIEERRFREDLFYRLNVVPLVIPPLPERRDDIPPLVEHYLARSGAESRVPPPRSEDGGVGKEGVSTCRRGRLPCPQRRKKNR